MVDQIRPNNAEKEFLNLAYNRFYDIFEEIMSDPFWRKNKYYRFNKLRECFLIYSELLDYLPIQWVLEHIKKNRPPMEESIGRGFFKIIRNLLVHFPFFDSWEEVWFNKGLINWCKESQSIDRFFKKYEKHDPVKYRFWDAIKKEMTYISINFPGDYCKDKKIFLKNILTEKDGVKFSAILMKKILDTQVKK